MRGLWALLCTTLYLCPLLGFKACSFFEKFGGIILIGDFLEWTGPAVKSHPNSTGNTKLRSTKDSERVTLPLKWDGNCVPNSLHHLNSSA